MKQEFLKFTVEELAEEQDFILWVQHKKNSDEWERFIGRHPEFKTKAGLAREIILLFDDKNKMLEEPEVGRIWNNISRFELHQPQKQRVFSLRKTIPWAAAILALSVIGSLAYLYLSQKEADYLFSENTITNGINDAKVIFQNGQEVGLKNESSKITLNADQKLQIENDSIIDLGRKITSQLEKPEMIEVIIPFGKKSELLLADGTKVFLNAGSRFAFPSAFTKKEREVYLEGEGYFEVAPDKQHPFIVKTTEVAVKVLGTRFLVTAYPADNKTQAVLLEGSVELRKQASNLVGKGQSVVLSPNEKAEISKSDDVFVVSTVTNAELYIAWIEGCFRYSKQSLKEVLVKLERYYNVKFVLDGQSSSGESISGKLDLKDSLEAVLVALNDVSKIEYTIDGNTVYIRKRIK